MKNESRKKKLLYNSSTALISQLVAMVCGFIMPNLYLHRYGTQTYGLISSITGLLSFISMCDMGIAAVVRSSLYEPLAKKNHNLISEIYVSAKKFYTKIALIFVIYIAVLILVYPNMKPEVDGIYASTLIIILAISTFAEYFFGINNQIILEADQKNYIRQITVIITLILNTVICVILIYCNVDIRIVKLSTALIYLFRPFVSWIYVNSHYKIDKKISYNQEPIKQKWNGAAQHFAYYVLSNTDVTVLTIMSSLENVAIYSLYALITDSIKNLILTLSNGFTSLFGNILANKEKELMNKAFSTYEWFIHTIVTLVFTITGILISPFICVYSRNLSGVNYIIPAFGILLTLAQAAYCIRLPYNQIILAAGHYKQTQASAIIEALINIIVSVFLVWKFQLIGVAVGTFVAMCYRTIYFSYYLSKNIINHSFMVFMKHIIIDVFTMFIMILGTKGFRLESLSYISWIILALKVGGVCVLISFIINCIFNKEYAILTISKIRKGKKRH